MISNWFSFIDIIGVSAPKLDKTANFGLDVLLFANFHVFLDFNDVNIKI